MAKKGQLLKQLILPCVQKHTCRGLFKRSCQKIFYFGITLPWQFQNVTDQLNWSCLSTSMCLSLHVNVVVFKATSTFHSTLGQKILDWDCKYAVKEITALLSAEEDYHKCTYHFQEQQYSPSWCDCWYLF